MLWLVGLYLMTSAYGSGSVESVFIYTFLIRFCFHLTAQVQHVQAGIQCPVAFTQLSGRCYYIETVKISWKQAIEHCEEEIPVSGSHLVSFGTYEVSKNVILPM